MSEIPASLQCLFPLLHPALAAPLPSLVPGSPFSPSPPTHIITQVYLCIAPCNGARICPLHVYVQILSLFGVHHALSLTPMLERLRVMAADTPTPPTVITERRMRQLVDLYGAMVSSDTQSHIHPSILCLLRAG